ncbi:MAG: glycosyltransferase family 4 protein [Streptosporangiaceae bacterium]
MTDSALLLTPSRGQGGGIERYVEALEWAFAYQHIPCTRLDLRRSGVGAHARLFAEARSRLRDARRPIRLVLAHRTLMPAAAKLARNQSVSGVSVICHGSDVWGARPGPRSWAEGHLMRRSGVRVVAASSFTAGALAANCSATVLPPGLSRAWFDTLVQASASSRLGHHGIRLVTAFRLADWRNKGLMQLAGAVAKLGEPELEITVCGTGQPSVDLLEFARKHNITVRPGLTDEALARQLAAADLFVLATRTKAGRGASGEGFGLVLVEAQVAGTPVIGPAYGGSHDAYIDQLTGVTPTDESASALAKSINDLLRDPERLPRMGKTAAEWARQAFAPEQYAPLVAERLL